MKRSEFFKRLDLVCSLLEQLEYDKGVCYDSALHGLLMTALSCVCNALQHTKEYIEHD